jgi:hypothetical protein
MKLKLIRSIKLKSNLNVIWTMIIELWLSPRTCSNMKIMIQINSASFPSIESKIMPPKFIKYIFTYQSKNKRLLGLIFKMEKDKGVCALESSISNHFIVPLLGGWISFTRHKKMEHNNFGLDSFVICTSLKAL